VAVRSVMDAVNTCGRTYSCGNTSQAKDGSKAEVKLPSTSLEIRCQSDVKFVVSENKREEDNVLECVLSNTRTLPADVFMCLAGAL
jgi:hypothetical protein